LVLFIIERDQASTEMVLEPAVDADDDWVCAAVPWLKFWKSCCKD
jgi:hypothetical protein